MTIFKQTVSIKITMKTVKTMIKMI